MVVAVLANDELKKEFLSKPLSSGTEIVWADSIRSLEIIEADVYFDLEFNMDRERISRLRSILPKPVIVNSVTHTLKDIHEPFARINGWPTMLQNELTEICAGSSELKNSLPSVFNEMGWNCRWVPDVAGMIVPRIVSMIVNEAWYALSEGISTKEEIDLAMKLGTNYPYGPFEWGEKIGIEKITGLLKELSRSDTRYTMAPLLAQLNKKDGVNFKY